MTSRRFLSFCTQGQLGPTRQVTPHKGLRTKLIA